MFIYYDYNNIKYATLKLIIDRNGVPISFIEYKNCWLKPKDAMAENIRAIVAAFYETQFDPQSAADLVAKLIGQLVRQLTNEMRMHTFGHGYFNDYIDEQDLENTALLEQRLNNAMLASICRHILTNLPQDETDLYKALFLVNGMIDRGVLRADFIVFDNVPLANFIYELDLQGYASRLHVSIFRKLTDPAILIGTAMIDKVKGVFVFGSGNDPESAAGTNGWSKTIEYSGRMPHTFLRDESQTLHFSQVGESLRRWGIEDDPKYIGAASAARIGNCMENGLLALYYSLHLVDDQNQPIFTKISMVRFVGIDHGFVQATYQGRVIYIDPWKNQCYPEINFAYFNEGRKAKDLRVELEVVADACKVDSKKSNCISKDAFLEATENYRKLFLLGLYIHPLQMDAFYGKYHLTAKHLSFLDFLKDSDFINQEHRLKKSVVLAEMQQRFSNPKNKPS